MIERHVHLRAFVRRDTRTRWIAACPRLDIVTQGTSGEDARRQLDDAVRAWFESCVDRGTLNKALRECRLRRMELDSRGEPFSIDVTMPA